MITDRDDKILHAARKHWSAGYVAYWISKPLCEACGAVADPPHHIRTRGAGGKDTADNLLSLCIEHHREIHATGDRLFGVAFPHLARKIGKAKT